MAVTGTSKVFAREILDSRGNPTIEVDVHLECGAFGREAMTVNQRSPTPSASRFFNPIDA